MPCILLPQTRWEQQDDSHQVLVSKESFYQDLFKMAIAITLTTFGLILLIAARIYWSFL